MGNCLVTKLKEAVQNDNLHRLGYVKVAFKSTAAPGNTSLKTTPNSTIYLYGATVNSGNTLTSTADGWIVIPNNIVVSGGTYIMEMPKYDLTSLSGFYSVDVAELVYTPVSLLSGIKFKNAKKLEDIIENIGNLSAAGETVFDEMVDFTNFGRTGNLRQFNFDNNPNCKGSFDAIGFSALNNASYCIKPLNCPLSIENFVANNRTAGRTTGTVTCLHWLDNTTFNGGTLAKKENYTISWTASTITVDDVTIDA